MDKIKRHLNSIGLALLVVAFVGPRRSGRSTSRRPGPGGPRRRRPRRLRRPQPVLAQKGLPAGILPLLEQPAPRHRPRPGHRRPRQLFPLPPPPPLRLHRIQAPLPVRPVHQGPQGPQEGRPVKGFFREGNSGRGRLEDLLKIYAYHSPKIKYEFIDPDKNPALWSSATRSPRTARPILESPATRTPGSRPSTEEDVTNAIIKVTRETKKVDLLPRGPRRGAIEETADNGFSFAKDELAKLGYEVKKLSLALSATFPADCALLVVPGPKKDLLPNELDTIKGYIGRGGRVLFMIDPETAPGLAPFLARVRLQARRRPDHRWTPSPGCSGRLFHARRHANTNSTISPETSATRRSSPIARPSSPSTTSPTGPSSRRMAKTSPNSWAETTSRSTRSRSSFDKDKDKRARSPWPCCDSHGAGRTKGTEPAKPGDAQGPDPPTLAGRAQKEARLAVFGDSDFAANHYFNLSGNGNFFLNAVNWLTEEADLISIQPKTSSPRTLQLDALPGPLIFFVLGHPPAARRPGPRRLGLAPEAVAMKFKTTLILLAVFAGLLAFVLIFDPGESAPDCQGQRNQACGPRRGRRRRSSSRTESKPSPSKRTTRASG